MAACSCRRSASLVLFGPADPLGAVNLIPEIPLCPENPGNNGNRDSQEN
jgi:hypothetical protein